MDTRDLNEKGLKLRREMFGDEAVDKRMKAFGAFGEPLQHIINAYAYGDVWSRPALPLATKSLAMVAMMAGAGRTNELRVHVKGALDQRLHRRADSGHPPSGGDVLRHSRRQRSAPHRGRCAAGERSDVIGRPQCCACATWVRLANWCRHLVPPSFALSRPRLLSGAALLVPAARFCARVVSV